VWVRKHIPSGDTNFEDAKIMKRIELAVTAVVCLLWSGYTSRGSVVLDFSNLSGASVSFDGNRDFTFDPAPTSAQFSITSAGPENGDVGYITSPTPNGFTIGAITTVGPVQTAPVTGTGTVTINDGTGHPFTGSINWQTVRTIGGGSELNISGALDLATISYSGSQADLVALEQIGAASESLNFTFVPTETLSYLATHATSTENFSGAIIVPVPEQTTLMAGAFLGLLFAASAIWNNRKRQMA
jgi:hypothetical protein